MSRWKWSPAAIRVAGGVVDRHADAVAAARGQARVVLCNQTARQVLSEAFAAQFQGPTRAVEEALIAALGRVVFPFTTSEAFEVARAEGRVSPRVEEYLVKIRALHRELVAAVEADERAGTRWRPFDEELYPWRCAEVDEQERRCLAARGHAGQCEMVPGPRE